VIRPNEVPIGFEIDKAREAFLDRTRMNPKNGKAGGTTGTGLGIEPIDDGTGGGTDDGLGNDFDDSANGHHDDDAHDNGHDNGHDDGHHGDHRDNHYYYNSHYSYYTHRTSPHGWWYVYGDYNGDGYTDYVCTNGSYSIYWYGWTGSYWGASPWYGWYGSSYSPYSWWQNSFSGRYRGAIYGSNGDLTSDPSYASTPADQSAMPEAIPLSALEVARLEMSIGQPDVAVDAYRAHLSEYPSDWVAVRELGIAMIRVGDRGDGIALINYAYSLEPSLAYDALSASVFEDSAELMRDAVIDAVGWGHRNPSASVWLTVAVLMQAEGRDGPALRMIERAEGYGLDSFVASEMRSALLHR